MKSSTSSKRISQQQKQLKTEILLEKDRRLSVTNPDYFIQHHCTIEPPAGEPIPFQLWDKQTEALNVIHNNDATVVLKSRRMGLSWLTLAYALWLAIFHQGSRTLMVCKRLEDSKEMVGRVRRMLERIQQDPRSRHLLTHLEIGKDNAAQLEIGASVFRALPATESAARQETVTLLLLDEFAFCRYANKIITGAIPTIEGGGKVIIVSTGNGRSGEGAEFAEQWDRAVSGESGYAHIFLPWEARPDRDEEWKDRTLRALGSTERFQVEYPATPDDAFLIPHATLVYNQHGINNAVKHGAMLDTQLKEREIPPPINQCLHLGIDWGQETHALIIWELEGGGVYIPPLEVARSGGEPKDTTERIKEATEVDHLKPYPVHQARYDSAGVQSMATFIAIWPAPQAVSVPFGRYKELTINYLKQLFDRAAKGETTRTIAISPRNIKLINQLKELKYDDPETGRIDKTNDHGPDALIAGTAMIAERWHLNAQATIESE